MVSGFACRARSTVARVTRPGECSKPTRDCRRCQLWHRVYLVMYWMVMPLSRWQPMPFSGLRIAIAIVTHVFCAGLPIPLITSRYSRS